MQKTSIRFFEDIPVRAVWDETSTKWWLCVVDMVEALTKGKNPRVYWAKFKSRNASVTDNLSPTEAKSGRRKILSDRRSR